MKFTLLRFAIISTATLAAVLLGIIFLTGQTQVQAAGECPVAPSGYNIVGGATSGPDVLMGTPGNDWIDGEGGNDIISGLGGNDILCGGPGEDELNAETLHLQELHGAAV